MEPHASIQHHNKMARSPQRLRGKKGAPAKATPVAVAPRPGDRRRKAAAPESASKKARSTPSKRDYRQPTPGGGVARGRGSCCTQRHPRVPAWHNPPPAPASTPHAACALRAARCVLRAAVLVRVRACSLAASHASLHAAPRGQLPGEGVNEIDETQPLLAALRTVSED